MKKKKKEKECKKRDLKKIQPTMKVFTKNMVVYENSKTSKSLFNSKEKTKLKTKKNVELVKMPLFLRDYPIPHENFTYTCYKCRSDQITIPSRVFLYLDFFTLLCDECSKQ